MDRGGREGDGGRDGGGACPEAHGLESRVLHNLMGGVVPSTYEHGC